MGLEYDSFDGSIEWFVWSAGDSLQVGRTFRTHGPCKITTEGIVFFSQIDNKSCNRKAGPAMILPSGSIGYTNTKGESHRADGPAIRHDDGTTSYYIHGRYMLANEYFLKFGVL